MIRVSKSTHTIQHRPILMNFFYYQICTLNKKNISYFRHYSKSLSFRFIYNFLLYRNEKNYIQSISRPFNQIFSKKLNASKNNEKFSKYIANKKLIIIGPLKKKIHVKVCIIKKIHLMKIK